MSKDAKAAPRAAAATGQHLRRALAAEVDHERICDRRCTLEYVYSAEVPKRPLDGCEGGGYRGRGGTVVVQFRILALAAYDRLRIVTDATELEQRVVPELGCREEQAVARDAQGIGALGLGLGK